MAQGSYKHKDSKTTMLTHGLRNWMTLLVYICKVINPAKQTLLQWKYFRKSESNKFRLKITCASSARLDTGHTASKSKCKANLSKLRNLGSNSSKTKLLLCKTLTKHQIETPWEYSPRGVKRLFLYVVCDCVPIDLVADLCMSVLRTIGATCAVTGLVPKYLSKQRVNK